MKSAWADKEYYYLLFDYALNGDLTGFLKRHGKFLILDLFVLRPA